MAGNKHRVITFTTLVISFLWQSGKVIWQSTDWAVTGDKQDIHLLLLFQFVDGIVTIK